ncbi:NADH dehydrogenase [ubiquinone] 1 alpha subcomplex subunit 11 [Nomia melanderi]|uniref:NADH dehydrogenase [ubiquinone] 1 alpha subcomplex subunit 11 n=1 Tax=Nomia melanderi TaxID=2448451 RepID=UPI0013046A64|nr:uncharacterized protein LOC116425777 [Nomia melanderi]
MNGKPDGTDGLYKLKKCTSYGAIGGVVIALNDICLRHNIQTISECAHRIIRYTVPGVAVGFMFCSTVFISTRLRGKDDCINYQLGVLAAAPIIHRWFKLPLPIMVHLTYPFLVAACIYKLVPYKPLPKDREYTSDIFQHTWKWRGVFRY